MLPGLKKEFQKLINPRQAAILQRFFKTGKGEYGEGDIFLGIKVPEQRKIAKKYINLSLTELENLLNSTIHEYRFTALVILSAKYKKGNEKKAIFDFFIKNIENINNWDLVDCFAPSIVGDFLQDKKRDILYKLCRSRNIWKKRIAIISTFAFIRKNGFEDAFAISKVLLNDKHDLIHKAVGWMLREIGKRDQNAQEMFLQKHYKAMPRTMLRYAIEKFSKEKRELYFKK